MINRTEGQCNVTSPDKESEPAATSDPSGRGHTSQDPTSPSPDEKNVASFEATPTTAAEDEDASLPSGNKKVSFKKNLNFVIMGAFCVLD